MFITHPTDSKQFKRASSAFVIKNNGEKCSPISGAEPSVTDVPSLNIGNILGLKEPGWFSLNVELQNSPRYKYEPPQGPHLSPDYERCSISCHNTTLRGHKIHPHLLI